MWEFFLNYFIKNKFLLALLAIIFLWVLFRLSPLIFAFFIAYIIMASLSPFVEYLKEKRIPNFLAITLPYLVVLIFFVFLIIPFYSIFNNQLLAAIRNTPRYVQNFSSGLGFAIRTQDVSSFIQSIGSGLQGGVVSFTRDVFTTIVLFALVIVVSIYLLFYRSALNNFMVSLFPKAKKKKVVNIIEKVNQNFGSWLRGQIILSLVVGFLVWLALTILGIEFAIPFAILAGILEIIPTIGPIIAAIPPVLVAFSHSPLTAGLVIASFIVIQQLENHLLVPQIMRRAVKLNPIIIILSVVAGSELFGIIGALLSVPFVSLVTVLMKSFKEFNKQ